MLVDESTAIMDRKEFDDLLEYSLSIPSGQIIGKRWKRDVRLDRQEWIMGEYEEHPDPKLMGIRWREIIVI